MKYALLVFIIILLCGTVSATVEDFTTYTEVDSAADLTVTSTKVEIDSMRVDAVSYVRKSYGSGHFGDFEHKYAINLSDGSGGGNGAIWAVSNGENNTLTQMNANNTGIVMRILRGSTYYQFKVIDYTNDNESDFGVYDYNITHYATVNRTGTLLTYKLYNDSIRTDLYKSTSITCGVQTYEHIFAVASRNTPGSTRIAGYIENLDLQEAGGPGEPSITSYAPTVTIWPEVNDSQLFNVTVNQSTQCRWYVNGSLKQTNSTPSTTHAYTNTSLKGGGCNITASVNNTNGTDSQTWLFEVGADSIDMVILSEDQSNLSCLISWNTTRIGSNVTHWNVSYNHTTQYYIYHFRYDNATIIVQQTAGANNETLWFNSSTLLPIGIYYINATAVTVPGISNIQNGSVNTTAQWVSWTVNQSANNIVIYDNGSVNASSTACEGQWSATHACANASDGNWSSYAESAGALTSYAYFNYTVPTAANQAESLWHIKSSADNVNLTVPSACWGGTLYLRARCSDIANSVLWQCDDGPGWTTLHTSVANIAYEQEMLFKYVSTWDNATAAPNITLTGLLASSGYNYSVRSCNVTNNSLCSDSSTYSFTTASTMYTISGFVLNATSGAGISGATVTGNGSLGGTNSGVDGNYSYSNVVNGVYSISASAAGYASNSTVVTVAGGDMTNQNITLQVSGTNAIYAYANELIMVNNWSAASQTFAQIDANLTNTSSYSYYNGTMFIDYWSGYPTNSAEIVPKNESCFIMFTADTTVECEPLSGDLTIPDATWFYTFLPGTVHKTVTEIDTSMTADGGDVWSLYRWSNITQSYNTSGTVQPNEGVVVYSNTTFVWSV